MHSNNIEDSKLKTQYLENLKNNWSFNGTQYDVNLPFTENPEILPDNYTLSKRQIKKLFNTPKKRLPLLKELIINKLFTSSASC